MEERRGQVEDRAVLQAWGATIRRYRQWKHWSRRELAARAGLSPVFLGEIERGEKDPSSLSLARLANALDIPFTELLLRVAMQLDSAPGEPATEQTAIPLETREAAGDYLTGVPMAQDETAFDLYKIARLLRSDQQVSLLVLARSLAHAIL
ncbi:MAG: helix-turn-helix domain-containing protein [Chloroflexota bacterium]